MADSAANEDPGRFPELGYCLFRDGLSADVVARYSALVDVLFAENKRGEPHFHSDVWRNLCCHPPILDAVEAVLGAELILFFSSVFMKQPHDNQRVDWHQDNTYWPSVSGTDVVTVWVALDDVDESNSCMNVVPRSHEGYRELEMLDVEDLSGAMLRRKVEVTEQMEADAVPMALAAGQISIHDSFLVHGSSPNRSGRRSRARR